LFSTSPFFSVCSFVCLLPTCECYILKMNEPVFMQIGINLPPWQAHAMVDLGVRRSKVKVTGRRSYIWKPGGDITLDPSSRVDRGMQ